MIKFFLGVATALLLLFGFSAAQPCEYEDGDAPCYWDAQARGNLQGRSFILITDDWQITLP